MKNIMDMQSIEVPCPHCGHKLSQTIGKLKTNPKLTCPSCKAGFSLDASKFRADIAKIDQATAKLLGAFGRIGK